MARSSTKVSNCFEVAVKGIKPKEFQKIEAIAEGEDFKTLNVADDYARATQSVLDELRAQRAQALQTLAGLAPDVAQAYAPAAAQPPADDDLDAMFDEIVAQESQSKAPKAPRAPRAPRATSDVPETGFGKTTTPRAPRTATQAAKSAAKNAASGIANTIDALGALFSTKPGTLGSGPVFNEDTYAAAKPLFAQAVADLKASGQDIREVMQAVIRMVMAKFGADTVAQMKPYIVKFTQDVRDGRIDIAPTNTENEAENGTGTEESTNGPAITGQQGTQALGGMAPGEDVGAQGVGGIRGSDTGRGTGSAPDDSGTHGPRVSGTRSGGSGSTSVRAAAPGKGRGRGRRGTAGTGSELPEERSTVPVDLFNQPTESVSANNIQAVNFRITEDVRLGQGGEAEKFRDNIAAIRTLKAIEAEGRRATSAEQRTLARYVGWGGLANAFPNPESKEWKDEWKIRGAELQGLLTKKEYDLARRSTLDSHYTSHDVVSAMWAAAKRLGFKGGMAAETSMGVGNFLGLIPEDLSGSTKFLGVEYDSLTSRIGALLYPQATVLNSGIQDVPLADGAFDLNIGNPPFGEQSLRFQFKPELNRVSIHNQFFLAGVDSLKPGGLQLNVVSRYLLDAMDKTTRTMLAKKAKLVGAIRLPDTAFKENARTEVVTDIVVLQRLTPGEEAEMAAAFDAANSSPLKDYKKEQERKALAAQVPEWVEVGKIADPLGGESMPVNRYFVANPSMILGTLERSGSMQFKNDITVRPGSESLSDALAKAVAKLPEGIMNRSQEAVDASIGRFKAMSDALQISLSGQEAGSIAFTTDGTMEQVYERETPEGGYELAKRPITESTPWSERLFQDAKGNWYTIEAKLDAEGKPEKVQKNGKPTNLNVYERKLYPSEADIPASMLLGEKDFSRLSKLVKLRDLMVAQINLETEDAPSDKMEANRVLLAAAYASFVAEEGVISRPTNSKLVSNMPDGALVQALELSYRKELTAAQARKLGESPRPESAEPAPIMSKRVIPKYEPPTHAQSPSDALSIVLSESGRVDIDRMASLLGKTNDEVIGEMFDSADKPLIFKDPETEQWVTRNDYLTGQVKKKLHAAQAANLPKHMAELEAVQPEPWGAENVTVLLGASFVPPQIYADFVQHVTGKPARVSFSQATNSYSVMSDGTATVEKNDEFGADGISITEMVTALLNSTAIKVTYRDDDGTHIDKEKTDLALIKAKQIASEFTDWSFADSDRRRTLVNLFNEKYNTRVNRQHDGSHLTLPGKVPDAILKLRRHQKNAIWRGISERFMLLDHVVGAGKTFTAIARAMERRRMGLSRKPAIIVPNHMVEQFTSDVYRLYPGAKVLAAGNKDFEKKNRRKLFAKIASGDWDVVIIPHSSFGKIGIAPETELRYLEKELEIAEQAIKEAWEESDEAEGGWRKPFNVKQAERLREKITTRMAALKGDNNKDRLLTFEQLGIDDLTVDEAHEFKNLFYSSRLTGVKGMGNPSGSQKAFDLYSKVRVLRESPTGTVTFMTGTPISNSAVEMFTMMRYLAADELKELGLEHFDAWRSQFVSTDAGWEPNETGRLKEVSRLGRSWSNMRSLMDLYYSFTDSVGNEDIKKAYAEDNNGAAFPIPKVKGGDRQSVVVQPTKDQIVLLEQTIEDFDSLPGIEDPYERNKERLRLMDRARKVSLDVRAAVPGHKGEEKGGKLEKISEEVKRIYDKWSADRGTQLIFLDRSVPKAKGDDTLIKQYDALVAERLAALNANDEEGLRRASDKLEAFDADEMEQLRIAQSGGWNAYQQIKDNLIASGIPSNEIRFIQEAGNDAQKQALFDAVKAGEVRVLLGSTQRMGAGTNVQDRLVGLHHGDVTWKPSDIEQREGRIIRQGNKLLEKYGIDTFEVEVLAYATERTIDAKMWSLNASKLKTINAIRNYDGAFSMDFEDEDSVSMAELAALASGNPLLLERVKLDSDINRLELLRKQHTRKMWGYTGRLDDAERAIKYGKPESERYTAWHKEALAGQEEVLADNAARVVTVDGKEYKGHSEAAQAVKASVDQQQAGDENAKFSVKVGERRLTSMNGALDAIYDALGDTDPFLGTLAGEKFISRSAFARQIAKNATAASGGMDNGESKIVAAGKMVGFSFEASLSRSTYSGAYVVDMALVDAEGKTVSTTSSNGHSEPKFTASMFTRQIGELGYAIRPSDLAYRAKRALDDAARAEKELPELRELAQTPFANADELKQKQARLEEVITALSVDSVAAAPDQEPESKDEEGEAPAFSRAPAQPGRGLEAFAQIDDLYALPKSKATDIEQIARDNWEEVRVRTTNLGSEKMHTLTFDNGTTIRITERKANPYGQDQQIYAMELEDGNSRMSQIGRPGENPEDVPPTDDVWLDVSQNIPAKYGAIAYNIAATYAYNNGKIFIGDPAGLSDMALRRRTEQMLSSALKFGTTEHLAPHPRQAAGDVSLGVPPLKWIYGDHVGNIERMIDVSLESLENGAPGAKDDTRYDPSTGGFTDKSGKAVSRKSSMGRDMATYRAGIDKAQAGWRTYARSAFLRSFLGANGRAEGSGILDRAINDVSRISSNGVGGGAYPRTERIFYSRDGAKGSKPSSAEPGGAESRALDRSRVTSIVDAIRTTWKNAPEIVVASSMHDAVIPERVRSYNDEQMSLGATGDPQGFVYGGKVYLVADQLSTPGHVVEVLFHEALGHVGLRGVFGDSLKQVLNQVVLARREEVRAKAAQYGFAVNNSDDMRRAAEEVLAEMAQTYPELGIVKRAIAAIRTWLRTHIPQLQTMKLTDAEIVRNFILPARRFVEQGGGGPKGGIAFSRGDAPANEATTSEGGDTPMFSRSATMSTTANKVVDKLNEHFSHAGTMSWWHKSFGSPYNLAQKSLPFKRVFTSAQDFLNDVSFYANEAADHASNLLPKLESWKDIGKSPISAADNKAIEAPIFEGTLSWARDEAGKAVKVADLEEKYADLSDEQKAGMLLRKRIVTEAQLKRWKASQLDIYSGAIRNRFEATFLRPGVVWSDAELKSIFNLTPEQADLYRQFHAAVGTSLDNLAKSEMLRYGGDDVADLRDMVLDAPTADDAAILLRDHLLQLADEDQSRADILTDMANGMVDRADKVNKLKKEGYAPLSRFGQYSVDVVVDGERQYFGLFETMADANQMADKLRKEYGAENVESGTMAQQKFELYKGITPESLELFGNMLGLDSTGDKESDKVFQEYLKLTKNNRSAMKRLIHRHGIAGYSTDTGRVLAAFIYSNARQTAAGLHMGEMADAVNAIPKVEGQLSDYATRYADYVKNPQEEAQAIRGLMFAQYLGGNVASAFVNFTQPMTVSFPYLSQFAGIKGAAAALGRAMADQRTGEYEKDLLEALRIADEQGVTQPQSVHELQAQARGAATLRPGDGTRRGDAVAMASNALSKLSLGWGKLFGMAEQVNRRTTFIAAYRIAVEKGLPNPGAFATKAVDETQFINNKGNRARAARGVLGSTVMTFKSYSINYMELLHRMGTQGGPEGKRAVALAMVMLFLMAGAGGLPFVEDLDDLIDGIAQRMGYNFSTKKAKQEFLEHWLGKAGAQFVDRGLTGIAGVPIDVAGRMGMGNLIPGTGVFMPKADHTKDGLELLGVGADMAKRIMTGAGQVLDGQVVDGALTVAPKAIGNLAQGFRMLDKGYYQDTKGAKVIDTTTAEGVFKSLGFQPQSVALVGQSNWINQSAKNLYTLNAQAIRAQWAKGIFENDPDQVNDARERMRSWNEKNPDLRIDPNMPAIIKKVREMRKTKEERIADTAPKAMRAQLRKDIAENAQ